MKVNCWAVPELIFIYYWRSKINGSDCLLERIQYIFHLFKRLSFYIKKDLCCEFVYLFYELTNPALRHTPIFKKNTDHLAEDVDLESLIVFNK